LGGGFGRLYKFYRSTVVIHVVSFSTIFACQSAPTDIYVSKNSLGVKPKPLYERVQPLFRLAPSMVTSIPVVGSSAH